MLEYRGQVKGGVVVIEGPPLPDGARVRVIPLDDDECKLESQPAFGIWRDRDDMTDSAEAAEKLRHETSTRRKS